MTGGHHTTGKGTVTLKRRAGFSAGCVGSAGSAPCGHNYVCELCVTGTIGSRTGMVVNIVDVDAVLKSRVVRQLDGKLLDRDVAEFLDTPPTPENIAAYILLRCAPALPKECRLSTVRLWWTPLAWVTLAVGRAGQGTDPMLTVTRLYDFSASHRLHAPGLSDAANAELFGKCNRANGHGHNYEVEVTLAGDPDPVSGRLASLDLLDQIVLDEVLTPFDHRHLNMDVPEFADLNPTSENLTRVIWDRIASRWAHASGETARLYKVGVRETARNYFEYFGPGDFPLENQ